MNNNLQKVKESFFNTVAYNTVQKIKLEYPDIQLSVEDLTKVMGHQYDAFKFHATMYSLMAAEGCTVDEAVAIMMKARITDPEFDQSLVNAKFVEAQHVAAKLCESFNDGIPNPRLARLLIVKLSTAPGSVDRTDAEKNITKIAKDTFYALAVLNMDGEELTVKSIIHEAARAIANFVNKTDI